MSQNLRVHSHWFNWMKFAPIVLARSFRSNCPTVGSNFSITLKNYSRSSDRAWHVRLLLITSDNNFPPMQVLQLARFFIRFSTRSSDLFGQWDAGLSSFKAAVDSCIIKNIKALHMSNSDRIWSIWPCI